MTAREKDSDGRAPLVSRRARRVWAGAVLALVAAHMTSEALRIDEITLGLLVLAVLPWLLDLVKSIRVGDFELELRDLERQVDRQDEVLQRQQRQINELVRYSMSASVFRHLCGIALLRRYEYVHGDADRRELYFLRDAGYIRPRSGDFVDFGPDLHKQNLADLAEPTPIGWTCIRLRRDEIPAPWADESRENLRYDPRTLEPIEGTPAGALAGGS